MKGKSVRMVAILGGRCCSGKYYPAYVPNRRALTLVEVLIVVAIVGILVALMLPSVRTSREAARRSQCVCNLKQLTFAIQSHLDAHGSLPLASTAPLFQGDEVQKFGAVGEASPSADEPIHWTAGQQGDGYSWLAQCLPYMEEATLYEKMTAVQQAPVVRNGKLADAAFAPSSNLKLEANGSSGNPFFWSVRLPALLCPSFPGEDDVPAFGSIPNSRVATGTYVALAATHYRSSPKNHLESGLPIAAGSNSGGRDCTNIPYCGNGGLPFPGIVDGEVRKMGIHLRDISKGTSKLAIIAESREEQITSWYSGLASYVVAAMPSPNGAEPEGLEIKPGLYAWTCDRVTNCDTALNKGDRRQTGPSTYYQPMSPHGGGPRIWGPSSRHPGVVIHGYADAHVSTVSDNIDNDVYLQMVLRMGPESDAQQ